MNFREVHKEIEAYRKNVEIELKGRSDLMYAKLSGWFQSALVQASREIERLEQENAELKKKVDSLMGFNLHDIEFDS